MKELKSCPHQQGSIPFDNHAYQIHPLSYHLYGSYYPIALILRVQKCQYSHLVHFHSNKCQYPCLLGFHSNMCHCSYLSPCQLDLSHWSHETNSYNLIDPFSVTPRVLVILAMKFIFFFYRNILLLLLNKCRVYFEVVPQLRSGGGKLQHVHQPSNNSLDCNKTQMIQCL